MMRTPKAIGRIALISMPFASVDRPSIQLGLLKAILKNRGFECDDFYLNVSFCKEIGVDTYELIAQNADIPLGEWVFSGCAFEMPPNARFLDKAAARLNLKRDKHKKFKNSLIGLRQKVSRAWLKKIAEIKWSHYRLIGFSCTFAQLSSSIALARLIKQQNPSCRIVFGGAGLEGSVGSEVLKQVKEIDLIIQGEGENAILEVAEALDSNDQSFWRKLYRSPHPVDLSAVPYPDYNSYFALFRSHPFLNERESLGQMSIPIQGSRGCWWADKSKCLFCGLNGQYGKYKAKTTERVLHELEALSLSHSRYSFSFVDNIIPNDFYSEMFPKIGAGFSDFRLTCEVRSRLSQSDILLLSHAGVKSIQPGIESLSTKALQIMRKGVTARDNLLTLKWGRENGLDVAWNLLYGFPKEPKEIYTEIASLIPKITHCQPPFSVRRIRIDRHSPLFEKYFEAFAKKNITDDLGNDSPYKKFFIDPLYFSIFPFDWNLADVVPYISYELREDPSGPELKKMLLAVNKWKHLWNNPDGKPFLYMRKAMLHAHVYDGRKTKTEVYELSDLSFKVAVFLSDGAFSREQIKAGIHCTFKELDAVLSLFEAHSLVVRVDGVYLWLPLKFE